MACARLLQRGASPAGRCWRSPSQGWASARQRSIAPFTPDDAKLPLALCFALASGPLPAVCFEGGVAHAPSPAQVAMAGGFVAQGAALGAVLGPPLLAAVTEALGGWAAAWWTMLVWSSLGLGGRRRRVAGRCASRAPGGRGSQ